MTVERTTVVRPTPGGSLVTGVGSGSVAREGVDKNPDGGGAPADIDSYVTFLDPTHRYRMNEASGSMLDTGSGAAVDLVAVGTAVYEVGGPDDSTEAIDGDNSAAWFRNDSTAWGTPSTGTVVGFLKDVNDGITTLCYTNTANEVNTFAFGKNPQGGGTPNRIGCVLSTTSFLNRRYWQALGLDVTGWNVDGAWHVIAFVQTGAGMRINIDGVEQVVTEAPNGTPPASSAWFDTANNANSRAAMMNARFASGSSNMIGDQSEWLIFDGVQLTADEILGLFTRITN